jgi:2-polyprenyl-3-methyl-5-hydroxy-6-metoxy-1,4-benzoquinol methylase
VTAVEPAVAPLLPTPDELTRFFDAKYRSTNNIGNGPYRRWRYNYFTPDDIYEATVEKLLPAGGRWLDVGGGRQVFPTHPTLAGQLASRVNKLVAVDPSENVHHNPVAHERHQSLIEEFRADEPFDLLTLRMVAEHIADPEAAVAALARLTAPRGRVVVYTVNFFSPITAAAGVLPFRLHHPVRRLFWGDAEERDVFPTAYKMNTRRALARLFTAHGLHEAAFAKLDDARTFGKFNRLNHLELLALSAFRAARLPYPENCLLGVYEKPAV